MDATTLIKSLDYLFIAKIPAFIWGYHGIGKSSIPKQWCKNKGWHFFDFRLNTQSDVSDFLGLQDFVKDSNGIITSTKHYSPTWLVNAINFCKANPDKGALIFLDELNRAARFDMIGPVFQMSLDNRLHEVEFPENMHIIIASNPNTEDYNTLSLDDQALMDRFLHIQYNPTNKEFFDYAESSNVDATIINFLRENPQFIEQDEKELEQFSISDFAKPSRRTWAEYCNKLFKVKTPPELMGELIKGLVGVEIATAFSKYQQNEIKPLSYEQITKEYKKHQKQIKKLLTEKEGIRTDIYKVSTDNLIYGLKNLKKNITKEAGCNMLDFLLDGPADYCVSVIREVAGLPHILPFFEKYKHRREEFLELVKKTRPKKEVKNESK